MANDCADALGRDGSWVGEDGILATADYLKRQIVVFFALSSASPIVYTPVSHVADPAPIMVAFFEPGHYCPIFAFSKNWAVVSRQIWHYRQLSL